MLTVDDEPRPGDTLPRMATSSASLDRSPKKNWVENAGGLPPYIRKIARAIHEKRGIPLSQAIPFAIGRIKRWAAGGDNVTAETKAKAAAAIAAWERLKGKAGKLTEAATIDENLGIPTPLLLRWVDELDQADALVEARREPRRLPDGTFAPLGTGSILAGGHGQGTSRRTLATNVRARPAPPPRKGPAPSGATNASRGIFEKYDDDGLRVALADPQLTGRNRRQAERVATSRGISLPESGHAALSGFTVDKGSITHEATDADGNAIRIRKESTGAWVVEVQKDGRWLPNRFTRDDAGRKAAEKHFLARAKGGAKGAAREQGTRTNVGGARKLVEAGAAGAGAPARMTASTTGRARAGAIAARKRPAAPSSGGKFDESKHPRGGKGSTAGGKFIAKGSSGSEVRAVQRRLGARVDGDFGSMTEAAVKRFQQKHGLTVDGIIGRQTVAALRGRKDAKRVKVGGLSTADRDFLSGHVRGKGRRRRSTSGRANATSSSTKTTTTSTTPGGRTKTTTTVVEAVAAPALLERVRALELGETARLADGGAVKHHGSEDGRELWTVGRPTSYGEGVSWGEQYRTPGEAVGAALTRSAGSSDPASLGGATRFGTSARVTVNGTPARFYGVTPDGLPAVTYDGSRGDPVTVTWPEIAPAPRLLDY
jgi:hypothetical protein